VTSGTALISTMKSPDQCVVGRGVAPDPRLALVICGEKLASVRSMLRRFTPQGSLILSNTIEDAAKKYWSMFLPIYPPIGTSVAAIYYPPIYNALYWWAMCYTGIRGGSRYRIVIYDQLGIIDSPPSSATPLYDADVSDVVYVRRMGYQEMLSSSPSTVWAAAAPSGYSTTDNHVNGQPNTSTIPNSSTEVYDPRIKAIEFEIPSQARNSYGFVGQSSIPAATNVSQINSVFYNGVKITVPGHTRQSTGLSGDIDSPTYARIEWSSSEDFALLGYQGPPLIDFGL